ncbi:DUF3375 family protein [Nesterenkonia alkaliphila]|nr:DUF3375 family protein [Nesterenkonia alkaliphila]
MRSRNASWRLLRASNAPLVLSFLGRFFIEENNGATSAGALAEAHREGGTALIARSPGVQQLGSTISQVYIGNCVGLPVDPFALGVLFGGDLQGELARGEIGADGLVVGPVGEGEDTSDAKHAG